MPLEVHADEIDVVSVGLDETAINTAQIILIVRLKRSGFG